METGKGQLTEADGAESLPLGGCLHNARLERISSSREDGSIVFAFDIEHLRRFFCLSDTTRFLLTCGSADVARAGEEVPWPATSYRPVECGKTETAGWAETERRLNEEAAAEVREAVLEKLAGGQWALRLGLHVNDGFYPGVYVRCGGVTIAKNDGTALALEEFLQMGEDYWEDFADQRRYLKESMLPR